MAIASPRVTTGPLPASRKIHVDGTMHPQIRVPMREIATHPTAGEPPLRVYDSSGPYTDSAASIDIARGLPRLRTPWIEARGDTDRSDNPYRQPNGGGSAMDAAAALEFPVRYVARRARDSL